MNFGANAGTIVEDGDRLTPRGTLKVDEFHRMMSSEGLYIPEGTKQMLSFDSSLLNSQTLGSALFEGQGLVDDTVMHGKLSQLTLHEIGHSASTSSGLEKISDSTTQLIGIQNTLNNGVLDGSLSQEQASRLSRQYDSSLIELTRSYALDEARAESFAYGMLPQTEAGRTFLGNLGEKSITRDSIESFASQPYYNVEAAGFDRYIPGSFKNFATTIGIDAEELSRRANVIRSCNNIRFC